MRVPLLLGAVLILAVVSVAGLLGRAGDAREGAPSAGDEPAAPERRGPPVSAGSDPAAGDEPQAHDDPRREDALERNRRAIALVDQGRLEAAIALFTEARDLRPEDEGIAANLASAYNRRGLELLRAGDPGAARERFARASGLVPDHHIFALNHAIATFMLKDYDAAREEIDAILARHPDDADALDYRGRLLYRENDLDGAVAAWRKATAERPYDAALLSRLAKAVRERRAEATMTRDVGSKFAITFEGGTNDGVARAVIEDLEDAYRSIGYALGHYPAERVEVILYTRKQFAEVSEAASWVGGLFDGKIRLPVARFDEHRDRIRRTVVHEYVHVVVKDLAPRCPVWLNEGIAQYFEGGAADRADGGLRALARNDEDALLTLEELRVPFVRIRGGERARRAYAQALSLVAWLIRGAGERSAGDYLHAVHDGKPHAEAFASAFGRSEAEAYRRWREDLNR